MASPLNHGLHRFPPKADSPSAKKLLITQIILLYAICHMPYAICYAQPAKYVRVAIFKDASSARIKIKGPYEAIDALKSKVINRGRNLNTTVTAYGDGIALGNTKSKTNKLFIKLHDTYAVINGRMFRGDIQLVKSDNTKFSVINYIELEDYIKGISIRETSHYWPIDSLKAQVIAFRAFAVYKMQENSKKDFDLTGDVYSQAYGGKAAERYRINKAVDDTKGLVLTYQNKILPAFYHATCGGHTEDASLLWNIDIGPLKGLPCNFCQDSPHFKWHNVLSQGELASLLAKGGYKAQDIKDILILGRSESGRITDLKIISGKKDIIISAKDFRNLLGPNSIKSTNFNVKMVDDDFVFEGLGWGHGAGLCQWGTYFMAKQGYDYQGILKYYYPGTEISQLPIE